MFPISLNTAWNQAGKIATVRISQGHDSVTVMRCEHATIDITDGGPSRLTMLLINFSYFYFIRFYWY